MREQLGGHRAAHQGQLTTTSKYPCPTRRGQSENFRTLRTESYAVMKSDDI